MYLSEKDCLKKCPFVQDNDCSSSISIKARFAQTFSRAIHQAHTLEISYTKEGLERSILHPINQWLIRLEDSLDKMISEMRIYSNELSVDESATGCLYKYPPI